MGTESRSMMRLGSRFTRGPGRLDGALLDRKLAGGLIGHQHCDLVDELLEDLRRRVSIAQYGQLVLNQRMPDNCECRKLTYAFDHRGCIRLLEIALDWLRKPGSHRSNLLSFVDCMKEYQAVVVKLTQHTREDEDTLTDLLNERSRGGWEPALMSQDDQRLTILFQRSAVAEA